MSGITIYGASDDLIEIEGAIREEFDVTGEESGKLVLSDGTVLDFSYGDVWRFDVFYQGTAEVKIEKCSGDPDADVYSDRVTVEGIKWVALVAEFSK